MKALILAADGFEDSELFYPYYRFQEAAIPVVLAAPEAKTIEGKHGYTFAAEKTFADLDAADYDILILPGGKGPETVRLDDQAVKLTREMMTSGKIIACICHGAQILISADVLQGRTATSWQGIRDDLIAAGANYEDKEVVVDGNLITSRCPGDLPAFTRELFKAMAK